MTNFARYAIYYAPPPGGLTDFAALWLGWDPAGGRACPHPALPGLPRPVAELTESPRKYGFHGTLKPPFRLAPGQNRAALEAALAALAATLAPVTLPGLRLARLGGFLALVVEGNTAPLAALAAEVVARLDPFRAAPSEAELTRRRAAGLTPAQQENLARWGYPYVMEEFRFHLTLTGALTQAEAEATRAALSPVLAPLLPRPFILGDLGLFGEDDRGRFHLLHRVPLSG
jgi:putative phosphonate metabolism protein